MKIETEKEFKFQLKKDDFSKLKFYIENTGYKKIGVINQVNFYIDTGEFDLRNLGMSLRVRHFIDDDNFEFTLKLKKENAKEEVNLKIKEEFTVELKKEEAEDIIKNGRVKDYLYLFENRIEPLLKDKVKDKLNILGHLTTERSNYNINERSMLSFDKSMYLGKEDYELELETENIEKDKVFLEEIFKENSIKVCDKSKSKLKRFIESLREI